MATLSRASECVNAESQSSDIFCQERLFAGFASDTPLVLRAPPIDLRRKQRRIDAIAITQRDTDERIDERIGEQVRLQPEIGQPGMPCVIVVRFRLDARVGKMIDLHFKTHLSGYRLNIDSQVQDRELLGELIEDAELARLGRVQAS